MTHHLVSIPEIAELLGVSQQRAHQIIKSYKDFPLPEAELAVGRVWLRSAVEAWDESHSRRPGRRSAATGPASEE